MSNYAQLGSVADFINGFCFKESDWGDSGFPIIRIQNLTGYGKVFNRTNREVPDKYIVRSGEILVSWSASLGVYRWSGEDGLLNQHIFRVVPNFELIDDEYLYWSLFVAVEGMKRHLRGATMMHVNRGDFLKEKIFLPPLAEQKRIAAILNKAETLRTRRRKALEQLDALAQAIFIEMFGDPVQNPKEWPQIPFGELLSNIESGKSPVCEDRPSKNGEWGVLKLGAVTKCEYLSSENKALPVDVQPDVRFEVKAGDLLFSRKNTYELVAACALVDETPPRMLLPDLIFRFCFPENSRLNSSYLHRLLITGSKRKEVQKLAGGAAGSMPNISKEKLRGLPIELPPLALQQEFAERVKKVELMKAEMRKSLTQLDALFSSLQHRAFRGEL